ncbi:hypothetical protein Q8791_09105 [Nocardiopsis sp. CT-R113]|uniref:Uncharacterized protein n=1 Tax=Nocardiopsis codii TaxID=3065942 RepID=A0ABU7K582_9ACTN|nr:hypothetical protein [Nocardiopsis sp. CT-R113]MEE2037375.1 hypothetical protein [Nocardiopsis sp. CT-R113]
MDALPLNRPTARRSARIDRKRRGTPGLILRRGRLGSPPRV